MIDELNYGQNLYTYSDNIFIAGSWNMCKVRDSINDYHLLIYSKRISENKELLVFHKIRMQLIKQINGYTIV